MERRLCFDIENDGFLEETTKLHCVCARDVDSEERFAFGPDQISDALRLLGEAKVLIGHNVLAHDLPVLKKLVGWEPAASVEIIDTFVLACYCYPDRAKNDFDSGIKEIIALSGAHSLKAWGIRLGVHKIEYQGGFAEFNPEMLTYCAGDVDTNYHLYAHLVQQEPVWEAVDLEMRFAAYTEEMSRYGFPFDLAKAADLCAVLDREVAICAEKVRETVPGRTEELKTPAYWSVTWPDGSVEQFDTKGQAETERKARKLKPAQVKLQRGPNKTRVHEFNPGSRKQVRELFYEKYGWLSPDLTDTGQKKQKAGSSYKELALEYGAIEEDTLRLLPFPEAEPVADYLMTAKRLSQLRDGSQSWLKTVRQDGRIHHRNTTIGAATFRNTHSSPNIAQVPAVAATKEGVLKGKEGRYGWECRDLFTCSPEHKLVGCDLSGIEARMLAHFLAPYDGGAYVDQVLNGDIHQLNVDSFQRLVQYEISRNDSKTPFYGWLYGSGNDKLGRIVVPVSASAEQEYQSLIQEMTQGSLPTDRVDWIAAMSVWGQPYRPSQTDSYKEKRFNKAILLLEKGIGAEKASEIAYQVVGSKVRTAFEAGIDGMQNLIEAVKQAALSGFLRPLDGRKIPVRAEHAALNTLLQGSAAVVMKRWIVTTFDRVRSEGIKAQLMAVVHDEAQSDVWESHVERYCEVVLDSIRLAGEFYRLAIPLAGEVKTGVTWAETH